MERPDPIRRITRLDSFIANLDQALRTSFSPAPPASRPQPTAEQPNAQLDARQRRHAAGLMRINHTGEVCAQALYYGQAFTARSAQIRAHLLHAADEEADHLAWCEARLNELGSTPSLTNPLWYAQSWMLGAVTGLAGDPISLGFVVETERQVEAHLHEHLESLPAGDHKSRAIVAQMARDEAEHGLAAAEAGAAELPRGVRGLMRRMAAVMKAVVYRL